MTTISFIAKRAAILSCILTLCFTISVSALDPAQKRVIDSGAGYFNVEATQFCTMQAGTNLDRFLQALADQESGGNPTATNSKSTASGKYQYLDDTWASRKSLYGPSAQYARAKDAPEAIQDAVAYIEYSQKFQGLNGDLFKLAVSHYWPRANQPEYAHELDIARHGLTPREYAQKFVDRVNSGAGSDIPLRYTEAPDFQTWLTKAGGHTAAAPVQAAGNGCSAGVPSDSFVFYSQYDSKWRNHPFGTSDIAESGCGPSSVAMIVATLKDNTVTPVQTADFGTSNGAYIEGEGSSWQGMLIDGPKHWGLNVENLGTDMDRAIEHIRAGGLVLASGSGPVPFTAGGHIIVLRGISPSGKILVGDPAHESANTQEWEPNELVKSIKGMFGVTK